MKTRITVAAALIIGATATPALADDTAAAPPPAAQPPIQTTQSVPVGTTTITSAPPDLTVSPSTSTMTTPPAKDRVTLYQSFRPNKAYLITGGALFIGTYATTAAIAANRDLDQNLYIPVVGPWIHLANQPDDSTTTDSLLTAGSGVLQGAGVLMSAASFFIPEKVPAATIEAGNVKMNITPMAGGRGNTAGIGAVGTF